MEQVARAVFIGIVVSARLVWAADACNRTQEPGECARILSNLGSIYYSQARYREAEPLFARAVELWSKSGQASADLAITLHNLAAVYRAQARNPEAILIYQRALHLRESLYGPNAAELVPVFNGLAAAYLEIGNRKEAERLFRRAETIDRQNFAQDDLRLGYDAYNTGVLEFERKQYSAAEASFEECAAIFQKRLPPDHPEIGNVTARLAEIYRREGRSEESAKLFRKAVEILEKSWGPQNPRLLGTLEAYSAVLRARRDYAEAESVDTRAMRIRVTQALLGGN